MKEPLAQSGKNGDPDEIRTRNYEVEGLVA